MAWPKCKFGNFYCDDVRKINATVMADDVIHSYNWLSLMMSYSNYYGNVTVMADDVIYSYNWLSLMISYTAITDLVWWCHTQL